MPVTMAFAARINQAMTPVTCPLPSPRTTYSRRPAAEGCRAELGEGVALQQGDRPRDQEREPHGRTGNLTGRTEQGEDGGADHAPTPMKAA
jgi:hypothetical protein